jgi:hypothetical protein
MVASTPDIRRFERGCSGDDGERSYKNYGNQKIRVTELAQPWGDLADYPNNRNMDPLLLSQKIQLSLGICVAGTPELKEGYCEVWCTSGATRVLIHLYDDGTVVATTSNGKVWVFDRLETGSQSMLADPDLCQVH